MDSDIKKRFNNYQHKKEKYIYKLETKEENKNTCIEFIKNLIKTVKEIDIKYLDGYELKVANERRQSISEEKVEDDEDEFYYAPPKKIENIKIDIVLKNDYKEFKIGEIDCDVKWSESTSRGYLNTYEVHLNDISIFEEYKNKGYGSYILVHMPMIISYLYKVEVISVTTTTEVFKYDKYKIHEFTYSERTYNIEKWLESNGYSRIGHSIEDGERRFSVFKLKLGTKDNLIYTFDMLSEELLQLCLNVWDNKNYVELKLEKCNEIAERLIDEKYNLWTIEERVNLLENIRENIIKEYNKEKEFIENKIKVINNVVQLYNSTSAEQLEVIENDTLYDVVIKLYCKYFNSRRVAYGLEQLGYMNDRDKRYTDEEVRYMVKYSKTKYKDLGEYAKDILQANSTSN